ncbi:tyrosine-type recombinase/integrase [Haloplanus natans]|uniref:tyrosine-type recombinase/integrase n=1 Tax=Haloplanus natans TaxID=376171 RepID=UPI0006778A33|nr:site-specific integrase [Haloplanus natans]
MSDGPTDLSPREAAKRYLDRRRRELTDESVDSYYYRLKLWWEWCEREGITSVQNLTGWTFELYEGYRSGLGVATSTLHGEMETLQQLVEYLERIGAVEEGLAEKVNVPEVPEDEKSRDTKLETGRAIGLIKHYRESSELYGTRFHALLELAWHTAARLGALRALDLRDYHPGEGFVEFVHRAETSTPLKNKLKGERTVALREPVCETLNAYIRHHRRDAHDDAGREPLFASFQGNRPSTGTLRTWMYRATQPCMRGSCPHGMNPATCDYRSHNQASQCPSVRAPHHVRTGSLTWHRDRGVPKEVTAERANASTRVIDRYYDKATQRERMELRRRPHLDKLSLDDDIDSETDE